MTSNPLKQIIEIDNKTKKDNSKMTKSSILLNQKKMSELCNKSANTYSTFEDKAEELFKKNKIDIVSTSFDLEKEIVKNLKLAVNPSGVQPNNDFY